MLKSILMEEFIMLLQFKFKNYKCFYDETILDLTATKEKQHKNKTFTIYD